MNKRGFIDKVVGNYQSVIEHFILMAPEISSVLVSSAEAKEGKTVTAIGLALTTAFLNPNKRILLVDFDLRHSMMQKVLRLSNTIGTREILAGKSRIEDAVKNHILNNLEIISAGKEPVSFPEILQGNGMVDLLLDVKMQYDFAFLDSPPVNRYFDVSQLSRAVDGVVMIIRPGMSKIEEVLSAKEDIYRAGGKVIGAIMNDFRNPIPAFLTKII